MRRLLRLLRRGAHITAAAGVSAIVLGVLAFGAGPIPALGRALDPGHGVWTSESSGLLPRSQSLDIAGLQHPVTVSFNAQGVPSIQAADEADLYVAQGYVQANFRLTQMDLERRTGEGTLSQIAGTGAVASDKFELRLGLLRTAEQLWAQTPPTSPVARELLAYSRGVNDYLAQVRSTREWPTLFSLTGMYPKDWTPVDSLVIQGELTQELDFTTTPLDYAVLERSLGAEHTMDWFPIAAPGTQSPYDPGPYRYAGVTPITSAVQSATTSGDAYRADGSPAGHAPAAISTGVAQAASSLLAEVSRLPAGQVHEYPDSNAWAANGPLVSGGGAMLAGDPHLPQTLPSTWYQIALHSPELAVSGVSLPGAPGIVIGRNAHISWSLTDVQNQSTLFYTEQTSASHPGEYFWKGRWQPMQHAHYTIDVRGGSPVQLTVDITVHGPIMTQEGQTVAVDWMGNIPSPDIEVLNEISKADNYAQFHAALADWKAPTQNFVYADDQGNIGAISAGYYPQVAHGHPWLPMPGTGADDVVGVIPYGSVPQVYDPPSHMVTTANQRPVGVSYPYYIGTTADFFDPGYRAASIDAYLGSHTAMIMSDFADLQTNTTDILAARIMPKLQAALDADPALNATQRAAAQELTHWNYAMDADSSAASIWFLFWSDYLSAVFQPWWQAANVPHDEAANGLGPASGYFALEEDLEAWTLNDPDNPAFTPPGGSVRTATQAMQSAFRTTVAHLSKQLGGTPSSWAWDRVHSIEYSSLFGPDALGYGPYPAGGDDRTVDAANGYPVSFSGPSWRMIVQWTGPGQATAEAIYPGGQSENPASPWYTDMVDDWLAGRNLTMPSTNDGPIGSILWSLRPGGEQLWPAGSTPMTPPRSRPITRRPHRAPDGGLSHGARPSWWRSSLSPPVPGWASGSFRSSSAPPSD
jgi:penicillin G amidase